MEGMHLFHGKLNINLRNGVSTLKGFGFVSLEAHRVGCSQSMVL